MVYTQYGQELMNVFYFTKTGPWTPGDLTTLAASVATEWTSNIRPQQTNEMTLQSIEATDIAVAGGAQVIHPVGVVGGNSGSGVATGITLAVKFATGLSGRSNRGRMYFIGTPGGAILDNQYLALYVAGLISALVTFFGNVETTTSSTHTVVSYCNNKVWRSTAVTNHVISYLATDNNIDSQRRRLTGRGI